MSRALADVAILKRDPRARLLAAEFLRSVSIAVGRGDIEASAVMVVVTDGDVHRAYWGKYPDVRTMHDGARALQDEIRERERGRKRDPIQAATELRDWRRKQEQEIERKRTDKPYVCQCGERFKSERGHRQHQTYEGARGFDTRYARIVDENGNYRGNVSIESAREYGWSLDGWACPINQQQLHVLTEVYASPPALLSVPPASPEGSKE